jgi:hypothetical protein
MRSHEGEFIHPLRIARPHFRESPQAGTLSLLRNVMNVTIRDHQCLLPYYATHSGMQSMTWGKTRLEFPWQFKQILQFYILTSPHYKPGWLSRYSDWVRAGRTSGRSSVPATIKNFLFASSSPALGSTQPPIQWVPGVKRPGREANHSPPTSAEVNKILNYTSTPPYAFMA